ncbi:MAG: MFS transporter [Thermoplasmata archaeon]
MTRLNISRRIFLAYCSSVHFLIHFTILAIPVLVLYINEKSSGFSLDSTKALAYMGIMLLLYGGGGVLTGFAADKAGSLLIILAGEAIALLSSAAMFFISAEWQFVLLTSALGLSSSFYHPAGMSLIANLFSSKEDGKAYGFHGAAGSVADTAAPLITAFLAEIFTWKAVFVLIGAINLILIVTTLWLISKFGTMSADGVMQRRSNCHDAGKQEESIKRSSEHSNALNSALTSSYLISVAGILILTALNGMGNRGFTSSLPTFMQSYWGLENHEAAALLSILQFSGIFFQLAGGWIKSRYSPAELIAVSCAGSAFSCTVLAFVKSNILFVSAAILYGFFFYIGQPAVNSMVGRCVSPEHRGLIFGLSFFTRDGMGFFSLLAISYFATFSDAYMAILPAIFFAMGSLVVMFYRNSE